MIFPRRGVLAEAYEEIFGIRRCGACVRTAAFSSPRKGVFGAENAFAHTPPSPSGNSPRGNFFVKCKHLFDFFLSARYTMNKCLKMRGKAR